MSGLASSWLWSLAIFLVASLVQPLRSAHATHVEPGDRVYATREARLRVGQQVPTMARAGSILVVRSVNESWTSIVKRIAVFCLFAFVAATSGAGCSRDDRASDAGTRSQIGTFTRIARFDPVYAVPESLVISPEKEHVAYKTQVVRREDKWQVAIDKLAGPLHDEVLAGSVLFSPVGPRLAYLARDVQAKRVQLLLVLLDKRDEWVESHELPFDWVDPGSMLFSRDGSRIACIGYSYHQNGAGQVVAQSASVILDGQAGKPYDSVTSLTLSPSGEDIAYIATREGRQFLVYSGREYPADGEGVRGIDLLRFSPDGKRFAFRVRRGKRPADSEKPVPQRDIIVVDGTSGNEYDWIQDPARGADIYFDPSGAVRYHALREVKPHKYELLVVEDAGTAIPREPRISETFLANIVDNTDVARSSVASPDGKRVAFVRDAGTGWKLVVDGTSSGVYRDIWSSTITFSPDSGRVACVVESNGKPRVLLDGQEQDAYDGIIAASLLFSPNGSRFAYVAQQGDEQFVVLDGRNQDAYLLVREMAFSPDGKRFGYIGVNEDEQAVVVDGTRVAVHDNASALTFGPNGRVYGYVAQDADAGMAAEFAVINGRTGQAWDAILRADGQAFFVSERGVWRFVAAKYSAAEEKIHFYTVESNPK